MLEIKELTVDVAGKEIIKDLNLNIQRGEVHVLFGPNGCGKTTLLMAILVFPNYKVKSPEFFMFDEPDSGVDVENIELIGKIMNALMDRDRRPSKREKAGLIITHSGFIMRYIKADRAHVMLEGWIACSGMPDEIAMHNIIIAEENSEIHIITGCSVSHAVNSALHLGISEFYVKKGAKITFTMIHNWSGGIQPHIAWEKMHVPTSSRVFMLRVIRTSIWVQELCFRLYLSYLTFYYPSFKKVAPQIV